MPPKFKMIMTEDMNLHETLGMIQFSINSSVIKLRDVGLNHNEIAEIKCKIEALSATMWSLLVMTLDEQTDEVRNSKKFLNKQVQTQLDELFSLVNAREEKTH